MHHAIILATDPGEPLQPLTDEATPIAFLPLGDRRPLLRQWVDRLTAILPDGSVWALVDSRYREPAAAILPETIPVVASLSEVRPEAGDGEAVLLQPAEQTIGNETAYGRTVSAGLDRAAKKGKVIRFDVHPGGGDAQSTGAEAWPWKELAQHTERNAKLLPPSESAVSASLDAAGWIDLTDWDGIRRLLAYVEKPWGHERLWALNRHYAGKELFIRAGESLSLQHHEIKDETIRIASGRMRFRVGPSADALETVVLEPGMSYAIPPRCVHQMEAIEDCTVIEVSTPHLTDVVRLEDRYGRT